VFTQNAFRSRLLAGGLIAAVLLLFTPIADFAQGKAPAAASNGFLVGFVFDKDMKTPVANAVVRIRSVSAPLEYKSLPTDASGIYKITDIQEGRYILGVTAASGNYNFDYVVLLKGADVAKLSVALTPVGQMSGGQTTAEDSGGKSFFKENWVGICVLLVVTGLTVYAFVHKTETSPVGH
jgi:hypothetical protein